jgi:hypothetical protein
MKDSIASTQFNHNSQTNASRKLARGLIAVMAVFVYSLAASAATQVKGQLIGISAGSTEVWGINASGEVYQYSGSTFNQIPGQLTQIAVGTGSKNVWGLNSVDEIWNYDGTKFVHVKGNLVQIAAGGKGVWGLNSSGTIYRWNGKAFVTPGGGQPVPFCSVYVGSYELGVWALDCDGNAYYHDATTGTFIPTDGRNLQMVAVGSGEVWGVTFNGSVWEYDAATSSWINPDPNAVLIQLSVGTNKQVYGVNAAGAIYLFEEGKFTLVDNSQDYVTISVGGSTAGVWALTADEAIFTGF